MRHLYHFDLCPFSRKVRFVLHEKDLSFKAKREPYWLRRRELLALNPLGQVPVLQEDNGVILADSSVIVEFLDEIEPDKAPLFASDPYTRAESRRIAAWFDRHFYDQVSAPLIAQKYLARVNNRVNKLGDSAAGVSAAEVIRQASKALRFHLDYLDWLLKRGDWLALKQMSLADICVGAHISVADYLDAIPWSEYPAVKLWYAKIKSRPAFRFILTDEVDILPPPPHYSDPDF